MYTQARGETLRIPINTKMVFLIFLKTEARHQVHRHQERATSSPKSTFSASESRKFLTAARVLRYCSSSSSSERAKVSLPPPRLVLTPSVPRNTFFRAGEREKQAIFPNVCVLWATPLNRPCVYLHILLFFLLFAPRVYAIAAAVASSFRTPPSPRRASIMRAGP